MPKPKTFTVYFDIPCMIDVEANDEQEAIEKAKDRISEAEEGEAYGFRGTEQ